MMCIPRSCDYNVNVRHVQPPLIALIARVRATRTDVMIDLMYVYSLLFVHVQMRCGCVL